jgi:hypothetical protein
VAATRGTVTGGNSSSETGTASRLGSRYVTAHCDTFETFATLTTWADGRVRFDVRDHRGQLFSVDLTAEGGDELRTVHTWARSGAVNTTHEEH